MTKKIIILLVTISSQLFAQNLDSERIWKLSGQKKSIYLSQGIFHYKPGTKTDSILSGMRNSFVVDRGYERVVLDFEGSQIPQVYGHISKDKKVISIDLFQTSLPEKQIELQKSKYVKGLDVYNVEKGSVSIELKLKEVVGADIFFLENPARLVVDLKK